MKHIFFFLSIFLACLGVFSVEEGENPDNKAISVYHKVGEQTLENGKVVHIFKNSEGDICIKRAEDFRVKRQRAVPN
ncbi:MAG: hypothetical protein KC505_04970 [Myxococcales bacterium]|nr:hypothetical protein [Myxococcales bacterium]USN51771.1 MAG: hypothetical protein H6731_05020 [Myxococcales bacterium]